MLSRPHIVNAEAKTAVVWRDQGFVPEEDEAFRATVAHYEKASGNKIDLSIMPFMALNQKVISVLTIGDVPDLIFHIAPSTILPQNAWNDKLVDVSDIVEAHKSELSHTALLSSSYYNSVTKKRGYYMVPLSQGAEPFHIWDDLVEKVGFRLSDAPRTWDAYWDFFKPMQAVLRGVSITGRKVDCLDRNLAFDNRVPGRVHRTHGAAPELRSEVVLAEFCALHSSTISDGEEVYEFAVHYQ